MATLFDKRRIILALPENADSEPLPTEHMAIRFLDRLPPLPEDLQQQCQQALLAALAIAPRLDSPEEKTVRDGIEWLDQLALPTKGNLTDRGRKMERMAAALARFARAALGDPEKKTAG